MNVGLRRNGFQSEYLLLGAVGCAGANKEAQICTT